MMVSRVIRGVHAKDRQFVLKTAFKILGFVFARQTCSPTFEFSSLPFPTFYSIDLSNVSIGLYLYR